MKPTDYAPRAAAFDAHLTGADLVGVEIGVDVGAHAHALLQFCAVRKLYLVDVWDKEYYFGYCTGRLHAAGFKNRVHLARLDSVAAAKSFADASFDFVYMDQRHEYAVVKADLEAWWPKLKGGGVLGVRNYAPVNPGLVRAVDEFFGTGAATKVDMNDFIVFKP